MTKINEAEISGDSSGSATNIASGENSGAVVRGAKNDEDKKIIKRKPTKMTFIEWVESEKNKKKKEK